MVLAKRIVPCLDVKKGRVVKGVHFKGLKDAGDPAELGARYSKEGADELVFLDITASHERRKTVSKMVREVASRLDIPFTVGGGIASLKDARVVLCNGADKVSVNTAAVARPSIVGRLAERFGSQCVVVAIDAKRRYDTKGNFLFPEGSRKLWFEVYTHGGRVPTGLDAISWALKVERLGAGELLVTSMDRDGTKDGYDIILTRALVERVNLPIIASGGCGTLDHFFEVFSDGRADAALAASVFHYGTFRIQDVKKYLTRKGIDVRP